MVGQQPKIASVVKAPLTPSFQVKQAIHFVAVAYLEKSAEVIVAEKNTQLVILEIFSQAKQSEMLSIRESLK